MIQPRAVLDFPTASKIGTWLSKVITVDCLFYSLRRFSVSRASGQQDKYDVSTFAAFLKAIRNSYMALESDSIEGEICVETIVSVPFRSLNDSSPR